MLSQLRVRPKCLDSARVGPQRLFSDALSAEIRDAIEAGVQAGDASIDEHGKTTGNVVNGWQLVFGAFGERPRMQGRWLTRAAAARLGLFGNPEEQKDAPGVGKDANWLPAPNGRFNLILRLYIPRKQILDGSWTLPAVEKSRATPPARAEESLSAAP